MESEPIEKRSSTNTVKEVVSDDILAPSERSAWKSVVLVATCTLAMITNVASSSAVSIFLPVIGRDLGVAEDKLQWLVSAFALSSGCLLLFFGRIADLHGRKKVLLAGTAWLGILSIGCGFAKNITTLYILRGFQGLGPAAYLPACLGILAQSFPPGRSRSAAFATFSAGAPLGGAVGTQLGAVLAQRAAATWRAPFFLFAGFSALCVIGGCLVIDRDVPTEEKDKRVDWLGGILVTTGLVLLTFVLAQGELAPQGWRTPYIIALLIVSVIFIAVFIWWQHYLENSVGKQRPPLMKLSLWTRAKGKFAVMQMIAFFEWSAFLSWYFWAQIYYEDYVKLTPVRAAVRMLPMTVAGSLCNVFVVLVISRLDLVILIAFGTSFTGIGALLFAIIKPSAPYWAYGFPSTIVSVFGGDFVFAAGSLFVAKVSLLHEQSLAGGLFQTLMQLGTAFGLAISTIAHSSVLQHETKKLGLDVQTSGMNLPRATQLKAYQAAQWTSFSMAMLCTFLAIVFLRGVGAVGEKGPKKPDEIDEEKSSTDK